MKKLHLGSLAALAFVALPVGAQMSDLSDRQLSDVTGQAYTVTVAGIVTDTYTIPFAHEVFAAKAPATSASVATFLGIWAPDYASNVAATRTAALGKKNALLGAATTTLQGKPLIGPFVPNVSVGQTTPP